MTVIRAEQPDDYDAIANVNRLAFRQESEAQLVAALRETAGFDPALSLVALRDDRIVGHIIFSPISIETAGGPVPALALAPMAVLPDFEHQGIGSELVNAGLDACRRKGHAIVVVLGHPEYYPKFGFTPASEHGLQAPFPVRDDAFMALALTPDGLRDVSGTVRYPPAFGKV